ncbi:phenylcoumaran benzylic ether reductase Betv6-like [Malania oleifera]|uniref:phenylcoumaran benzylic ether reductase Betv6-like n=1 Tax=Malania oleifera TaxID=397392 RepID=UPI0025AEA6D1|nr:phenylcoumaran benzylic ether reductase Betv6-like [Malania oleifera]
MASKSKILFIGGTGYIGKFIVEASAKAGHPIFALVRDSTISNPDKGKIIESFKSSGVQLLTRFIPSEFGSDPDRVQILDLLYDIYSRKAEIRRLIESEGIPHACVSCNFFMSYFLPSLLQPGQKVPPRDKVTIFGDGSTKGVFVKESDVATFTINTVDDPRTLNKVLYLRPSGNVYSMNELFKIWESKIGKKLGKFYVPEEIVLRKIKDTPYPECLELIFIYSAFIKGDHTYFDIESSGGVEGTQLHAHVKYTTISDYLDTLL